MKITISGTAGSGKSTIASMIAKKFRLRHYSIGDLQRELAKELGMTIKELGDFEQRDPKYDNMMDEKQKKIGKENDNLIIDSWLAPKFIPDAIKIFLDAEIGVRAKRRLAHKRKEEEFDEIEKAKKDMLEREKINQDRFLKFYNYDYKDKDNYDIVVDTTHLSIEEGFNKIVENIKKIKF